MVLTMATAKQFEVEVTVPEGMQAGDTFKVLVEAPEVPKQSRGKVSGIALEDMTDDELKVEATNAKSVLYKAKKREADADTIAKNEARVAAVEAEKARRKALSTPEGTTVEETDSNENTDESVDSETANEI